MCGQFSEAEQTYLKLVADSTRTLGEDDELTRDGVWGLEFPGGYGRIGDWERVRPGWFTVAYARAAAPDLPVLWAEFGTSVWIKRDDCTGLAFGGNKSRQLEFYIGHALEQGADTLLTTGAVQSNHVRMTVAAARHFCRRGRHRPRGVHVASPRFVASRATRACPRAGSPSPRSTPWG